MAAVKSRWQRLQDLVRNGSMPDRPDRLREFIELYKDRTRELERSEEIAMHYRVYELLLETICDSLIPKHWRFLCLDYLFEPCRALKRLCETSEQEQEVRRLQSEARYLSSYFLSGL